MARDSTTDCTIGFWHVLCLLRFYFEPSRRATLELAARVSCGVGGSMIELLVVKAALAGAFVVLFSILSEAIKPHSLSGLLSAAPSIALANLGIAFVATGPVSVAQEALGMVAGGIAMVAYVLALPWMVQRLGSLRGSVLTLSAWAITAFAGYLVLEVISP